MRILFEPPVQQRQTRNQFFKGHIPGKADGIAMQRCPSYHGSCSEILKREGAPHEKKTFWQERGTERLVNAGGIASGMGGLPVPKEDEEGTCCQVETEAQGAIASP